MFLGVDVGTSSVKTVVIDGNGLVVCSSSVPLPIYRPKPLWSEQEPADWWNATEKAVLKLDPGVRKRVRAIGLSGQMHGATLLNRDYQPLRPAILWNDGRSAQECVDLQRREPAFQTRGANVVMPGFTAPKLEWVRRHEPALFDAVAMVLLPKDYVRLKMTGDCASDMSDSAGTLWMDVVRRRWHGPLLAACGLNEGHMPALYEGPDITGRLRGKVADDWGMPKASVVAGGSDNAAGALGAGVIDNGDALVSLGTSGVTFVASERCHSEPALGVHSFCHAVPNRWHQMAVMLSAASCLEWACRATQTATVESLLRLAEGCQSPSPIVFLPYLSGERTPHNNPQAKGVLFGINHDVGPAQIAQAVVEGVAFGMADGLDALTKAGVETKTLSVIGGGARSDYFCRVLATALGQELICRDDAAVGPAVGAARLAAFGVGESDRQTAFSPPPVISSIAPDRSLIDHYASKRRRFISLYASLKPHFSGA